MTTAKLNTAVLCAGVFGLALTSTSVFGQSVTERMIERYSEPNEFYLTDSRETEIINFKKDRLAAVCIGESEHTTALDIKFDDRNATLYPGNCLLVEAKKVKVSAAGELDPGWDLRGTVRTIPE